MDIEKKTYKTIRCPDCRGYGQVLDYSYDDFEGCKECNTCNGGGSIIYYISSGNLAQYPGGPFLGGKWNDL